MNSRKANGRDSKSETDYKKDIVNSIQSFLGTWKEEKKK